MVEGESVNRGGRPMKDHVRHRLVHCGTPLTFETTERGGPKGWVDVMCPICHRRAGLTCWARILDRYEKVEVESPEGLSDSEGVEFEGPLTLFGARETIRARAYAEITDRAATEEVASA